MSCVLFISNEMILYSYHIKCSLAANASNIRSQVVQLPLLRVCILELHQCYEHTFLLNEYVRSVYVSFSFTVLPFHVLSSSSCDYLGI